MTNIHPYNRNDQTTLNTNNHNNNKAIVDIRLHPLCAIPPLHFAADNRPAQRLQSSISPCGLDQSNLQLLRVLDAWACLTQKLLLPLQRSSPPRSTLFLGPSPLIIPNSISIGSAILVWVPNAMLHNEWRRKPPKLPLPFGISSLC